MREVTRGCITRAGAGWGCPVDYMYYEMAHIIGLISITLTCMLYI